MSKKNIILYIIVIIMIIGSLIFYFGLYLPKEKENVFKQKVDLSIQKMMFKIKSKKGDYILINFPDKSGIISKNGKINNKENLKEFTKGYIIMYDINNVSFKLTDGRNCAYKKINEAGKIIMNKSCNDYFFITLINIIFDHIFINFI